MYSTNLSNIAFFHTSDLCFNFCIHIQHPISLQLILECRDTYAHNIHIEVLIFIWSVFWSWHIRRTIVVDALNIQLYLILCSKIIWKFICYIVWISMYMCAPNNLIHLHIIWSRTTIDDGDILASCHQRYYCKKIGPKIYDRTHFWNINWYK